MVSPGRVELAAAVRPLPVVMPGVLGQDAAQVAFTEDQHAVGDLGPGGEHEPFSIGVRARASGRDLRYLDAGPGQGRVEGCGELPGAVANQEPEAGGVVAEVHPEVADLLGGPRSVRVGGYPEDVHVAAADLDDEEAVQALEGNCAVHVEEVGGKHGRGLGVQDVPPGLVGVPFRSRRDLQCLEDPADCAPTRWPSFSSSP